MGISEYSKEVLRKVSFEVDEKSRRSNFYFLSKNINGLAFLKPLASNIAKTEVPMTFPCYIRDNRRDGVRRELAHKNIFCPVHWLDSDLLEEKQGRAAKFLCENTISIPIDSRYDLDDMAYIADVLHNIG